MNCKFCQAELEEGNPVCPACGKDNAVETPEEVPAEEIPAEEAAVEEVTVEETAAEETGAEEAVLEETPAEEAPVQPKRKVWKIVAAAAGCVVLLLALAAGIYYGINGSFTPKANDVKYKDSYTVEDDKAQKAADKVVATVGSSTLTNGQLQIYYWMQVYDFLSYYGGYASFFGLDYTQPLDTQMMSAEDGITWQQYFLELALDTWHRYQVLTILAEENGFELDAELQTNLDTMPEQMEEMAISSGYESADAMIQAEMGAACSIEDYRNYLTLYNKGFQYFSAEYEKLNPTDEEIAAYFAEHEADFESQGITKDSAPLVDVRHILVTPQGGVTDEDGNVTYSDEEMEACLASAQAILDEWLAGEATEDSFAELANAYSEDSGSNTTGGLYTNVTEDSGYVEEFENWCIEEGRQVGDYGIIQTVFGYHIMYLSDSREAWYAYAQSSLLTELSSQMLDNAMEEYPMEVKYKNIILASVDLG